MCLLFETIRVSGRILQHLEYHQDRVNRSRRDLFNSSSVLNLESISVPGHLGNDLYKCRVIYDTKFREISFLPYKIKPIRNLKLVTDDHLEYPYKYLDRSCFTKLSEIHPDADEIIVVRDGLITDTTYSNLAFLSGSTWYTPSSPLLQGTCRQRLLDQGLLIEREIKCSDLIRYSRVSLINAMIELKELSLSINAVF